MTADIHCKAKQQDRKKTSDCRRLRIGVGLYYNGVQ